MATKKKSRQRKDSGLEIITAKKVLKYSRKGKVDKLVRALESHEGLVNCVDDRGETPLYHAAFKGRVKCLKELLKRGADPNKPNISGHTPCHAAAIGGKSPQFPHELLGNRNPFIGIHLTVKGLRNIMSYHLKDANKHKKCLEYLICFGGDWKVQSKKKETIQDIATKKQKNTILEVVNKYNNFQKAIAKSNAEDELLLEFNTPYGYWVNSNFSKYDMLSLASLSEMVVRSKVSLKESSYANFSEANPADIQLVCTNDDTKTEDGSVWHRGYWTEGVTVTIRRLADRRERRRSKSIMCVEYMLREMEIAKMVHHPNIVLMMGSSTGPLQQDMFQILEPLNTSGSLYNMLHHMKKRYTTFESISIIKGILEGLVYLHSIACVAHCLLSSHAVQFTPNGCVKLCNLYCSHATSTKIPSMFSAAMKTYLPWMAPELMVHRVAALESDVFSIGVLIWEVWSATPPWPGLTPPQLGRAVVRDGQRLPITSKHSIVAPLIKTCFGSPVTRLPAVQLLSQVNYLHMVHYCS